MKLTSRLVSDGWVEQKIPGYRYHFQVFQLELDTLGTKNFGIGPVVKELQLFGRILENPGASETFQMVFVR